MDFIRRNLTLPLLALAALGMGLLVLILSSRNGEKPPGYSAQTQTPSGSSTAGPTISIWQSLLQTTPFAYIAPIPDPIGSPLDGTYAKLDPSAPQWWGCRRCADYRPAGGIWRLNLDRGVLRIYYEVTGWRSIASFTVSGDRLRIFNDPYCPEVVGEYDWKIEGGGLRLEAYDDACSFGLRSRNLSQQPWPSCPRGDASEGESSLRQEPPGCEDYPLPSPAAMAPDLSLRVAVYGGDSRFFERAPDVFASANSEDRPPPQGIRVSFHRDSIAYGIQRVLWWNGDWIEATTNLPFAAMGVQFLGEPQIGWARVLFDGAEVWRGNTSAIWSKYGRHGGYVEISGFGPGQHTMRAESLGFDYRPVTVASFGFSYESGVEP